MSSVQSNYQENMGVAREGHIANTESKNVISRSNEDAATIGFGKPVVQGANDRGCKLATAGDTKILGVTARERSATVDGFKQYDECRILEEGSMWVTVSEAVVAGDPVTVTVDGATFGKTTGAGKVELPNSRWETSAADTELAVAKWG